MTVFLAHAPADRHLAEALEKVIERRGQFAELDDGHTAMRPVSTGDVFVLLVSQALTFATARLRLEQRALDAWATGRLVVVKLDHGIPPVGLRDLPAIDASFEAAREFKWNEVADAVRDALRAPPPPRDADDGEPDEPAPPPAPTSVARKRLGPFIVAVGALAVLLVGAALSTAVNMAFFSKGVGLIQGGIVALTVSASNILFGAVVGASLFAILSRARAITRLIAFLGLSAAAGAAIALNLWYAQARELNLTSADGGLDLRAAFDRLISQPFETPNSIVLFAFGAGFAAFVAVVVVVVVRAFARPKADAPELRRTTPRPRTSRVKPPASDAVFVSYARANDMTVLPLVEAAKRAGRKFWLDQQGLSAGDGWAGEIVRAIKAAGGVVVMCSQAAFESDHVKREIYLADRYKKKLVPVFIEQADPPEDFEYFFAGVQSLNLFETPEEERPQALIRVLGAAA